MADDDCQAKAALHLACTIVWSATQPKPGMKTKPRGLHAAAMMAELTTIEQRAAEKLKAEPAGQFAATMRESAEGEAAAEGLVAVREACGEAETAGEDVGEAAAGVTEGEAAAGVTEGVTDGVTDAAGDPVRDAVMDKEGEAALENDDEIESVLEGVRVGDMEGDAVGDTEGDAVGDTEGDVDAEGDAEGEGEGEGKTMAVEFGAEESETLRPMSRASNSR